MAIKHILSLFLLLGLLPGSIRAQDPASENTPKYDVQLIQTEKTDRVRFVYKGRDVVMELCLEPGKKFWGPIIVKMNMRPVATILNDTGPVFEKQPIAVEFVRKWVEENRLNALWKVRFPDSSIDVNSTLELSGKTLIVDYQFLGESVKAFSYGEMTGLREPELLPPLVQTTGLSLPPTLKCEGLKPFMVSFRIDIKSSSSGSRYFGREITENGIWQLGSVDYSPFPGDSLKEVQERFTLAFSPVLESK